MAETVHYVPISGVLHPCRRSEQNGCTFRIEQIGYPLEENVFEIYLISNYTGEIVEKTQCTAEEIGPWLLDRIDY